jgi:hypothetical protein
MDLTPFCGGYAGQLNAPYLARVSHESANKRLDLLLQNADEH